MLDHMVVFIQVLMDGEYLNVHKCTFLIVVTNVWHDIFTTRTVASGIKNRTEASSQIFPQKEPT